MKIILEYDQASGILTDANGAMIATYIGMNPYKYKKGKKKKQDVLMRLVDAGFGTDDLIKMKNHGIL